MTAARWLRPRFARLAVAAAVLMASTGRAAIHRRRGLTLVGVRALWWGALALLVAGGPLLLGTPAADAPPSRPLWLFGAGLGACAAVAALAVERRLRWGAFVLGLAHAGLGLLTWAVLGA